ncbi:MAG: prolipoprotein diacylglyceryl transferase [Deinococcota bacterium]|jgi:phosphatidylglycerol:prolipoprotein diacylglycerol transferase|nr:prolipoprotein diacylglyceryl transferase [Deinococcota bacterium]
MDPVMIGLGPLEIRWYGFFIALGVFIGTWWAARLATQRGLDPDKLMDMVLYLVIAGIVGARLVYVLTSPGSFFGPGGDPLSALYIWQGGLSFHGAVLGALLALWIYARINRVNMWAYADVMMPAAALGIMGGRLGNFMNGSDTDGRLTNWPIGFTWPQPGTDTFGAVGRFIFGDNLWAGFPGVCTELGGNGLHLPPWSCPADLVVRGPVHLTQFYGFMVGFIALFIVLWALRRSLTPGYVFWQFILWYSVLRFVIEEPFRNNPLAWNAYLASGLSEPGIGLFTVTQLFSVPIIFLALYMLLMLDPEAGHNEQKRALVRKRAR